MRHFFSGFFQLGYVTADLDAALAAFERRFGAHEFLISEPGIIDGAPSPTRRIALTYIDDVMTEIIEPDPEQATIFDDARPEEPGAMRFHHFGYLVDDHEATLQQIRSLRFPLPFHGMMPGVLDYSYADTRQQLGHFSEFIRLDDGGRTFFGSVPRHTTR